MQLRRARRLSSASTTYHGDRHVVYSNIVSLRAVVDPRARLEIHRAELPALQRVARRLEALLLVVAHREPVLDEQDPVLDEHALEDGALPQNRQIGVGQKPMTRSTPARLYQPVEQDDLAPRECA